MNRLRKIEELLANANAELTEEIDERIAKVTNTPTVPANRASLWLAIKALQNARELTQNALAIVAV